MDGEEDVLIWPLMADGDYSVRSAYHFLITAEDYLVPSSSSLPNDHAVWKKIWKMKVPNKIRHFIWRAAKDSLPTKVNLKARHVPVDDVCEGCGDYSESTMHSLWLCDQARAVWMSGPEFQFLIRKGCRTFIELLKHLFKEGSGLQVVVFATTCWCLWERRNRMRVRQTSWQIHEIEGRARMMASEFWDANEQEQQRSVRCSQARWSPPPASTYKANFDAVLFDELDCAGLGVVYRDHSGHVIAALSQKIGLPRSVEMAEALAARRAVEFARELSLFDVIVEGDCLQVLRALSASGDCNTLYEENNELYTKWSYLQLAL
ncbi:putative ribonuclease h protein [Quercus suber]|uniref:Ribonuclease h protein n=1 Tax=Quercus suber TaxID=58331 RepID=A0AAW0M802_QUESU